jgi:hypothetical protein
VAKNRGIEGIRELQLYQVDFGQSSPKIELVLDNKDYQNNHFDLAKDGKTIVVQRIERAIRLTSIYGQLNSGKNPNN